MYLQVLDSFFKVGRFDELIGVTLLPVINNLDIILNIIMIVFMPGMAVIINNPAASSAAGVFFEVVY